MKNPLKILAVTYMLFFGIIGNISAYTNTTIHPAKGCRFFANCSDISSTAEPAKSVNASSVPAPFPYMVLQLAMDAVNTDAIMLKFIDTAKMTYVFNEDARYLQGFGKVSLYSFSQDSVPLAINGLPLPKQAPEVIRLNVYTKASGVYQLKMKTMADIPELFEVWLMDKYKNDSLDMRKASSYSFAIDKSVPASFGADRFTLVIRQDPAYAYHLVAFAAVKMPNAQQVKTTWQTVNEQSTTSFAVERSVNSGKSFIAVGNMQSAGLGIYSLVDKDPATGENLYRLKQENINDTLTYSKVVSIFYDAKSNNAAFKISTYPNPVSGTINLTFSSKTDNATPYKIEIISSTGVVVKRALSAELLWQGNVNSLQPGIYIIHVSNNNTNTVVGRSKFMKL